MNEKADRVMIDTKNNVTVCFFNGKRYVAKNREKEFDFRLGIGACLYKFYLKFFKYNALLPIMKKLKDSNAWKELYTQCYYLYFLYNKKVINYFEKKLRETPERKFIDFPIGLPF